MNRIAQAMREEERGRRAFCRKRLLPLSSYSRRKQKGIPKYPFCFLCLSAAAAAAEEYKKRNDYDPDALIIENIAKTVVHICSLSPPFLIIWRGAVHGGKTAPFAAYVRSGEPFGCSVIILCRVYFFVTFYLSISS